MSIHTDAAFNKALRLGAFACRTRGEWQELMSLSKRELAEIAIHLSALATGTYEEALESGQAFERLIEERDALKANGSI